MTDAEIIKALECCCKNNNCEGCPLDHLTFSSQCASELAIKSLDLVNRQKADIERLNKAIKVLEIMTEQHAYDRRKAALEAIKEFAERLKGECSDNPYVDQYVLIRIANKLVKEKAGETE